jgi:tRNA threonylcarbamoyladenosine biosynthesis protein TsaB
MALRTLVIDTATELLSVALFEDTQMLAHSRLLAGRGHAEALLPAIAALPEGGRADRIAVDIGPGSFTGVRIGLAAARALAFAWGVPLTGYTALSLIAAQAKAGGDAEDEIIAVITGGHGELFWQRFAASPLTPLGLPTSTPISELAGMIDAPLLHGSGAQALVGARGHGTAMPMHPDAASFALLPPGLADLPPHPLYGRGADARPMANRQPSPAGSPHPAP